MELTQASQGGTHNKVRNMEAWGTSFSRIEQPRVFMHELFAPKACNRKQRRENAQLAADVEQRLPLQANDSGCCVTKSPKVSLVVLPIHSSSLEVRDERARRENFESVLL